MPSRTTRTVFQSLQSRMWLRYWRAPHWTRAAFCSSLPPEVMFVMAQTASFWDLESPWKLVQDYSRVRGSRTNIYWINDMEWCLMQGFLRLTFFITWSNRSIIPASMTFSICTTLPAVILETVQAASFTTLCLVCWSKWARWIKPPALITASVWK